MASDNISRVQNPPIPHHDLHGFRQAFSKMEEPPSGHFHHSVLNWVLKTRPVFSKHKWPKKEMCL